MVVVWATLLTLVNLGWLAAGVLGLPGNWLMVLSAAGLAWWRHSAGQPPLLSPATLVAAVVLAAAGELVEFLAGAVGSRRAGGTRRGAIGALAGGLVGGVAGTFLIPVPLLGALLGACAGACLGAAGLELTGGRSWAASVNAGVGAGFGTLLGRGGKLAVGIVIWAVLATAAFWP
jgi:uncharacterized protein YqgC (DUF456 family)